MATSTSLTPALSAATQPAEAQPDATQQLVRGVRAQLATPVPGVNDYLRAWADWSLGLALAPERQQALLQSALAYGADSARFAWQAAAGQPSPCKRQLHFLRRRLGSVALQCLRACARQPEGLEPRGTGRRGS